MGSAPSSAPSSVLGSNGTSNGAVASTATLGASGTGQIVQFTPGPNAAVGMRPAVGWAVVGLGIVWGVMVL